MRRGNVSKAPLFALIAVGMLFSWIVGYGWFRTFTTWGNDGLAYLAGIGFPIIGIALAWAIAHERRKGSIGIPAGFFCILFIISALGTINTLFFQMQGLIVMQGEIETARTSLVNLNERAKQLLATPEHESYVKKVQDRWNLVKDEIENEQRCGQGPEAAKRIAELQEVLPAFRPLSGGGCAYTKALTARYGETIVELIKRSPSQQEATPFLNARGEIERTMRRVLNELDQAKSELNSIDDIAGARKAVLVAADNYSSLREKVESVSKKTTGLPAKIDTRSVLGLGNMGEVARYVLNRWNDVTTAFFVSVAVLLDIVLVLSFRGILAEPSMPSRSALGRPSIGTLRNY